MNLKEHNNNQYTKENTEVEKYLLRIIQRYFDIENNYTKESIEAMILESLTRFKQLIISEKGFIFSLNKQTGHLTLTIRDFDGEEAINKMTAFNKDFGTDEGTICEGNDERLSDDRKPLTHIHSIAQIENLKEALESVDKLKDVHFHNNQDVLNILRYVGSRTTIDLILIEELVQAVDNYCDTISKYKNGLKQISDEDIDTLIIYKTTILNELAHAKELIQEGNKWIDEMYEYIDKEISDLKNSTLDKLLHHVSKETLEEITEVVRNSYRVMYSGEMFIPKGTVTCNPHTIGTMADGTPYGTSFVQEESKITINYNNVSNPRPKLFFRFENEAGETCTYPLPYAVEIGKNRRMLLIDVTYDANRAYVVSRFVNKLSFYGNDSNFYDDDTLIIPSRNMSHILEINKLELEECDCELCLVDSQAKNNFIVSRLLPDTEYYIQGYNFAIDGPDYVDDTETVLSYTNWDTGEPDPVGISSGIKYNTNKKWADADIASEMLEYIVEYKIKPLSTVYNNARIYYQILGNKEGL